MKTLFMMTVALFVLTGCDPGRKAANQAENEYEKLSKKKPADSIESSKSFVDLAIGAKVIAEKYGDKKSGELAKALLKKMEADYEAAVREKKADFLESSEKLNAAHADVLAITNKIRSRLQSKGKLAWDARFPFKVGDCAADLVGDRFSEVDSYLDIEIFRIDKLSQDEVLLRYLFKAQKPSDSAIAEQVAQKMQPEEKNKILVENFLKISCGEVDDLIVAFDDFALKAKRFNDLAEPLLYMAAPFNRQVNVDVSQGKIEKSKWIANMTSSIPNLICKPDGYLRKCFKINDEQCKKLIQKTGADCLAKIADSMPDQIELPKDGIEWGSVVGKCIDAAVLKSWGNEKIKSEYCENPDNWNK